MKSNLINSLKLAALIALSVPASLFAEDKFIAPVTWSDPTSTNTSQVFDPAVLSNNPLGVQNINQLDLSKLGGLGLVDPGNLGGQAAPQPAGVCPRMLPQEFVYFTMKQKNIIDGRTQEQRTISSVEINSVITHVNPVQQLQWITIRDTLGCRYEFNFQEHAVVLKQFETLQAALINLNTTLGLGVNKCGEGGGCWAEIISAKQVVR